ncbi:MAG: TRAP transporter small permease [Pseudomonadota bacterium]
MKNLVSLTRALSLIPLGVASIVLFFLMAMTFMDVLLRSAFNNPIEASTELTRFSMAIIVFSSLPVLSGRGEHISVDLLDGVIARLGLDRIWTALMSVACGVILWWPANRVVDLAERSRSYGDLTEYLQIPTFYVSWFIAIMTFVTMGALVVRGLTLLFVPSILETGDD